jgi:ketosteroid isomerase-like protein
MLDHLADDVVFEVTIPEGTPISGEFRGKQAVTDTSQASRT